MALSYIVLVFLIFFIYNLTITYRAGIQFHLRPYNILFILIFIYSLSVPFYYNVFGTTYYGEEFNDFHYSIYYLTCLMSLLALTFADILFIKKYLKLSLITSNKLNLTSYRTIVLIALFVFFFLLKLKNFNIFNVISYGENALSSRELARTNKFSGVEDIFFEQIPNFFIFTSTFILIWKKGYARFIWVPISLYIISIAFISGSRGYILQVILPFLVFMLYRSRKYNPYFLLFFLAFGLIVSNFIEIFRSLTVFDLNYLFDVVINNSFNLEQIIASSGELSVSVNLLKLIKELNYSTESFQYGQSFIEQLSTFIPNGLLPYRPLIASEKFVYLFYNDIYNIGGGYGFFILQDGYWDFGVFGSMVSMFLFMILLNSIFIFFYRKFKEGSVFYFFLLVIFIKNMVVFSVRSGIIASLKALWIDFIPLVVFFTIIHFLNLIFWKKALK